jgi:hypothetical protein
MNMVGFIKYSSMKRNYIVWFVLALMVGCSPKKSQEESQSDAKVDENREVNIYSQRHYDIDQRDCSPLPAPSG